MGESDINSAEILRAWDQGVEEFNSQRYWHAHEFWERGWKDLPEPGKTRLQAMIQVTGAIHLLEKGRERPAKALCATALEKIRRTEPAQGILPRVEIEGAPEAIQAFLRGEDWKKVLSSLKAKLLLPTSV